MKTFKIVYILIGVILTAGVLITSFTGLAKEDLELYEKACSLEDGRSDAIWPGLKIRDYPVALRKGNKEYVIFEGSVEKRRPVLPVIACTAYPAGDTVNVFVPCKSVMDSLGQIVEGFSSGGENFLISQFSVETKRISENQYVALLYHETMHAFQLSRYEAQIAKMADWEDEKDVEEMITELERDPSIQALHKKQAELLHRLVTSEDGDPDENDIREYIKTRQETLAAFRLKAGTGKGDMIGAYIDMTELLEGTAFYAEAKTASVLDDSELYEQYLSSLQETLPGREKYYRSGMGICMLLDRVSPGWKDGLFAGGLTLAQMLEKAVEVSDHGGNEVYDTAGR
jgi:hypothetical protein